LDPLLNVCFLGAEGRLHVRSEWQFSAHSVGKHSFAIAKIDRRYMRMHLSYEAFCAVCGAGTIYASFQWFWAVAAMRDSSFASHGRACSSRVMDLASAFKQHCFSTDRPAGQFQGAVFGPTLTGRPTVRVGIVSADMTGLYREVEGRQIIDATVSG